MKALREFKNIHAGGTVFVVGNGPSLTPSDLDLIRDFPSFAMNRIGLIFDSCEWRPTYLVCTTTNISSESWRKDVEVARAEGMPFFLWKNLTSEIKPDESTVLIDCDDGEHTHKTISPETWSDDPIERVSKFGTSMLVCLQLAVYMGASRIVLIGADLGFSNSFSQSILSRLRLHNYAQKLDRNHFEPGYGSPGFPPPQLNLNMKKAHEIAAEACGRKDIELINASRGGSLEVHQRLSLEAVLAKIYRDERKTGRGNHKKKKE